MDELAPDLNRTLETLGSTLLTIAKQMDANEREHKQEIGAVKKDVSNLREDVSNELSDFRNDVSGELSGIKDSQYLEPWQAANVTDAAKERVGEILRDWCNDNCGDMDKVCHKYFGKFVRLLHGDAKKSGLEIGKIIYTPKRNYEMLLEFIGKWYPKRGVEGQMKHYDKLESMS